MNKRSFHIIDLIQKWLPLFIKLDQFVRVMTTVFTRISAAFPMRRLFEEFRIIIKPLQNNSKTALEISCHQKRCSAVHSDYISPLAYWVLYPEFLQYVVLLWRPWTLPAHQAQLLSSFFQLPLQVICFQRLLWESSFFKKQVRQFYRNIRIFK